MAIETTERQWLIGSAVAQLEGTERGQQIKRDLLVFLEGAFASADRYNAEACVQLIDAMRDGYAGSVLDALRAN